VGTPTHKKGGMIHERPNVIIKQEERTTALWCSVEIIFLEKKPINKDRNKIKRKM